MRTAHPRIVQSGSANAGLIPVGLSAARACWRGAGPFPTTRPEQAVASAWAHQVDDIALYCSPHGASPRVVLEACVEAAHVEAQNAQAGDRGHCLHAVSGRTFPVARRWAEPGTTTHQLNEMEYPALPWLENPTCCQQLRTVPQARLAGPVAASVTPTPSSERPPIGAPCCKPAPRSRGAAISLRLPHDHRAIIDTRHARSF